jgi:hypothetical protein
MGDAWIFALPASYLSNSFPMQYFGAAGVVCRGPTLFPGVIMRSSKSIARRIAREALSDAAAIRAVYQSERARRGRARVKNVRVVR